VKKKEKYKKKKLKPNNTKNLFKKIKRSLANCTKNYNLMNSVTKIEVKYSPTKIRLA